MAYRNIRNEQHAPLPQLKAHLEQLWQEYWEHADENFLREFPYRFHQRWFEMHLTVALKRTGLSVTSPKPGPDVLLETNAGRIWIEAVAPTGGDPAENADAVVDPSRPGQSGAFWLPRSNIALRVAQGFAEKSKVFANYIERGIVPEGDACVIAINLHGIPYAALDARGHLLAALYGVGDQYVLIDRESGDVTGGGVHHRPGLQRASGAQVKAQPFLVTDHTHISAVIGSSADAANGTYRLGDDFLTFPNTRARRPLQQHLIPLGLEYQLFEQPSEWRVEAISHIVSAAPAASDAAKES